MRNFPVRRTLTRYAALWVLLGSVAIVARPPSADGVVPQVRLNAAAVALPRGAIVGGTEAAATPLSGEIALAPADPSALADYAQAVSTPGNAEFRHYLPAGAFAQAFGAAPGVLASTASWLSALGFGGVAVQPDHLFVTFHSTAGAVASALDVTLDRVRLPDGIAGVAPQGSPLVPASLAPDITGILGMDTLETPHDFAMPDPHLAPGGISAHTLADAPQGEPGTAANEQSCPNANQLTSDNALSAQDLSRLYQFDPLYAQGRLGAGVNVALVEMEPYSPSDVDTYLACYAIDPKVTDIDVDGGPGNGPGSGEAALDIEVVAGLAPESNILVYQGVNAAQATSADMMDIFEQIAQADQAQVVSTSWGQCETNLDPSFLSAENTLFEQMAAQGQTVFAAAGDSGSEGCFISSDAADTSLAVDDPASQPYVTGVGGVTTAPSGSGYAQSAWNTCAQKSFASCADAAIGGAGGGGRSSMWPQPTWQASVGGGTKRVVPDVSASADPFDGDAIVYDGGWVPFGGTSAAAPTWAASAALVDQGCSHAIGFANPALYATAGDTGDITAGDNDYTNTNGGSFAAGAGFDMATGLGVPDGPALETSLEASGCPSVSALSTRSGPVAGGTAVVVSGANLTDATSVHVGTASASFSVNPSVGSLAFTMPPGPAGTVAVTVTTPSGTSAATVDAQFTYLGATPPPVVTAVDPDNAPLTGRPTVDVDGSGFIGATAVDIGSTPVSFSVQSNELLTLDAPAVAAPEVVDITVTGPGGASAKTSADLFIYDSLESLWYIHGYTAASTDGNVYALGEAPYFGSLYGKHLNAPIVGMATTPSEGGYWLVAADGGIFTFGNAQFYGSTGALKLNKPIVGMAATPNGQGYWLVAADGGIFTFGDAQFHGSTGSLRLNKPIVAMAATANGGGYWLVASDGGVFAFGDAQFYGSTGAIHLNSPIESVAATPDGGGYWMVASDGGVFAFGDAQFFGSSAGKGGVWDAMAVVPQGVGYLLMSSSGWADSFGGGFYVFGSGWGAINPTAPLVGMSFYTTSSVSS